MSIPSRTPPRTPDAAPSGTYPPVAHARRSVVLPTALIALGVVWLLGNLGVATGAVWDAAWRLWPIVLVAWGVEMIVHPVSRAGRLALAALVLAALALGVWWGAATIGTPSPGAVLAVSVARPAGAREARLTLRPGVNRLDFAAGDSAAGDGAALLSGEVRVRARERLEREERMDGAVVALRLAARNLAVGPVFVGRPDVGAEDAPWTLRASPDVPMTLDVKLGVGRADLDLRRLAVRSLTLEAGVGALDVTLPALGAVRATVRGGVGAVTLRVPRGVEARVEARAGLGGLDVRGGFDRDGDAYVTRGYAAAAMRADVRVEGGVGRVTVEREE